MTERAAPRLAEVPEADAAGRVAAVYEDIRRVTGVDTVALVYRVLASNPETLEAVWDDLAPNLAAPRVRDAALTLDASLSNGVSPLVPELVTVPYVETEATLSSFARINRLNVVGLTALLEGVAAPIAPRLVGSALPAPIGAGLPMADIGALPLQTVALLEEMSASVAGPERPLVIPSLFRYFAHDERLLRALWTAVRPVVDDPSFTEGAATLRDDAATIAANVPYRVRPLPHGEAHDVVERFLRTIPTMILVGGALAAALGVAVHR
ncbi:MAG TPA: hypothetical protein VFN99_02905 [Gaiella sp.]|nr:hypothetical protein [Gaiella sp.]